MDRRNLIEEYEIIGAPSVYSMRAANEAVAAVAVLMMGAGRYGYRSLRNSEKNMPSFRVAGSVENWIKQRFRMDWEDLQERVTKHHVVELQKALDSVELGLPGDTGLTQPKRGQDLRDHAHHMAGQIVEYLVKRAGRRQSRH